MKATGEVMAIDRSFPAALQKAVRALEIDAADLGWENLAWSDAERLRLDIATANDERIWAVAAALRRGWPCERYRASSGIDIWFVRHLAASSRWNASLRAESLPTRCSGERSAQGSQMRASRN